MTPRTPAGKLPTRRKKLLGPKRSLLIPTILAMSLFMAFAIGVGALQNPGQNGEQTGARNAKVKPKRAPVGRDRNSSILSRTGTRIANTWSSMVRAVKNQKQIVSTITPGLVPRDRTSRQPLVTNLTLQGANLRSITARVVRDGQPLDSVVVRVEHTSDSQAHLALAVFPNTPLGPAQLVVSKHGYSEMAFDIRVIEPSEFALEPDTVGLWHFDARDHGVGHLLDAAQNTINLTSARASRVTDGRFGAGHTFVLATADANNTVFSPGTSSFTVEGWVKAPTLGRDYVLVGKEANNGQDTEFTLKALASGSLRAEIYDTAGLVWQAETSAGAGVLTDRQWHAFALVVDRETGSLSLYLDGHIKMLVPAPTGFGAVRNFSQPLQLGAVDAGASGHGPEEFPSVLDEIRISSTAHKPEKIAADYFGNDEPKITFVRPSAVKKGTGPIEVTLSGYGLLGATVLPDQPGVTATVLSSTLTSMRISLAVYEFVPVGPASLLFRDVLGRGFSVEFTVEELTSTNLRDHDAHGVRRTLQR